MKKDRMFSISQKLISLFVLIIVLPTAFLSYTSYKTSSRITENEIRNAAINTMGRIQENISSFIQMQEENLLIVSQNENIRNILTQKNEDMIDTYDILQDYVEGHKVISSVYIGRKDKVMELYPKQDIPAGYDPTSTPWFKSAASKRSMIWTEPYIDTGTKKLIVTLAIPMYDDNKELVGVLGADISLDELSRTIGNAKVGTQGYVILVDGKGLLLTHPDKSLVGKEVPAAELKQALDNADISKTEYRSKGYGNIDYVFDGSRKCAYYLIIENIGWKVVGTFEYGEIAEKSADILKTSVVTGIVIIIAAILMGYLTSRPIIKALKTISSDMSRIGNGDFSVRNNIKSKDEIGLLAKSMNKMTEELGQLLNKVKGTVSDITSFADSLAASSEEATASTEEISKTVSEISNAAVNEVHNIESGLSKTNELSGKIQKVSEAINSIKVMVDKSNELNQDGIQTVEGLREKSKLNDEATEKVGAAIDEVDKYSEQIGEIISAISGIADQTNLLALNASIEAARAGESGRGFAVVADEIRKLAEQSAKSTGNIQNLIIQIQEQSKNAVESMETAKPIIRAQSEAVNETETIFKEIFKTFKQLADEASGITALNSEMVKSKNEILQMMESISASSQQTNASTQQVAASAQEQLAGMEEVSTTAEQLNLLAKDLSTEVEKFKV